MSQTKVELDLNGKIGGTISTADNTDTLTLTSTDADGSVGPNLRLYRNSSSPADNDDLATIDFEGRNDNSQDVQYGMIRAILKDASDGTEDGTLEFHHMKSGSLAPSLQITPDECVINESSNDYDFRCESNSSTHAFFVDGGDDRVGVGTDSPVSKLTVAGQITATGGAVSAPTYSFDSDTNTGMSRPTTDAINFVTGGSERMRITSDGYFGINTNSPSAMLEVHSANNIAGIETQPKVDQLHYAMIFRNSSGNDVGNIAAGSSSTAFNTSSDYRLKENVDYTWDATTRLKQLKPVRFNWIVDDTNTLVDGFLAHEVSSIVPEAISGEKDGTETRTKVVLDASGNQLARNVEEADWVKGKEDETFPSDSTWEASKVFPKHQAIDQSKLVPLMVKTIQELEARIKTLEDA